MNILLILSFIYHYDDNHQLKSSFAIEDSKKNSKDNISEFIQQGDYNLRIIRDYQKAIEWYDKVLAIDTNNVYALSKKGEAMSWLYNFSQSSELVDKALTIDLSNIDALTSKGKILSLQHNYSEAIKYYDKALEINPNYIKLFN